jgi:iron complex outermembrane receptor protein
LQEVIVTAERRPSNVQHTADSISVRTGPELQTSGRYQLSQILEDVPGIVGGAAANSGGSFGAGSDSPSSGLTIRGISSNVPAGGAVVGVAPAAALYVDGVYQGLGSTYDIDRVEVLRGPQGTLYGRSATSGLVAINTADPQLRDWGGNAAVEVGNYDLQHYTAALNAPILKDVLALRVSGNRYRRNGFFSADGGYSSSTDAKIKLLYKPNQSISVLFGAALEDNIQNNGGVTVNLAKPDSYQFLPAGVGPGSNESRQIWALMKWDLGPATLTYQPAYRTFKDSSAIPTSAGPVTVLQTASIHNDYFMTHELRLASNPGSTLTWQAGMLAYDNSLASTSTLVFVSPPLGLGFRAVIPKKTTQAVGAFGEATYPFANSWRMTLGARYDYTDVQVQESYTSQLLITQSIGGDAGTRRFYNATYKARLEHDLTPQNLLYASVSTGFSPGDVTLTTGATFNPVVLNIKAETLHAYEIGSKNRFLDNSLQINGALYYYDYGGYQVSNINFTPQAITPTFGTINIPVKSFGGELETIYRLTADDHVNLNLAYTDAYYTGRSSTLIPTGTGTYAPASNYIAFDRLPNVVPFTASLGYDHIIPLASSTLTLHADARYLSSHNTGLVSPGQLGKGAYPYVHVGNEAVADLSLMWEYRNYSVSGYVRNVGNNDYKNSVAINNTSYTATPYDPRTFGMVVSTRF